MAIEPEAISHRRQFIIVPFPTLGRWLKIGMNRLEKDRHAPFIRRGIPKTLSRIAYRAVAFCSAPRGDDVFYRLRHSPIRARDGLLSLAGHRLMSGALRVGQGFDTHRFGAGDHLMLGGVRIAHEQGIVAHSDGDVLLHTLTDALLGAAGLGDLGHHFPDSDPRWAGAASLDLLASVMQKLTAAGWRICNADCTVIAEAPRLAPHLPAMRANVAAALAVDEACVSLKATTAETMGFIGRGEGIAALAVVLLTSAGSH